MSEVSFSPEIGLLAEFGVIVEVVLDKGRSMGLTHIHEGDIGTQFIVQVVDALTEDAIDLTAYDTLEILFQKPDGTVVTQTATLYDATNGKIKYTTVDGNLTPSGQWQLQGHVAHSGNSTDHKTEVIEFKVYANLA